MALEPRDRGLLAYSLRSRDEVRDPAEFFDDIPKGKADPQMVEIAAKIISQQEGPFDPDTFSDRYEEALRKLVADKQKGRKITAPETPRPPPAGDLMEALRRSLGRPVGDRRKAEPKPKPSSRAAGGRRKRA
jgi:DNA end-binding protein Ku